MSIADLLPPAAAGREVVTPQEIAQALLVSDETVRGWIEDGARGWGNRRVKLAALRAGSVWRIRKSDLAAFLAQCKGEEGAIL